MTNRPPRLQYPLPLAFVYLLVHCLCVVAFPADNVVLTYFFQGVAVVLALIACVVNIRRCLRREANSLLVHWVLFTLGIFLWLGGVLVSGWGDLFRHISGTQAFYSDLLFFFYGIPVLLALSVPNEARRSRLFLWLDGIQAVIAGLLAYVEIFDVVPFSDRVAAPIAVSRLVITYNIENVVLALAATFRLIACPPDASAASRQLMQPRRFYKLVAGYLWVYAVSVGFYNYLQVVHIQAASLSDFLIDLPFLFLAISAAGLPVFYAPDRHSNATPQPVPRRLAIFIDNASPIFFSFAMLALGVAVARRHFRFGIGAIVLALIFYGLRATVLQGRYMESQSALREARDRLEELTLQDFLTRVANRRRFDQTLESEWHRAVRLQHPISLLMIDVDYFKVINDRDGHRFGDECLIRIAGALRAALPRSGDLLARYGGEEFAAILPATDPAGARAVAERMQQAVYELNIPNQTAIGLFATVSIGMASCQFILRTQDHFRPVHLIEAADRALYLAKQLGRNRIETASLDPVPGGSLTG